MIDENDTASNTPEPNEPLLNAIEARALGALMEKQLTTPDQYPLTLNSLVTACNQKTSREPVSNYSKGEVERCVNELRDRKLIEVEYGSRANRYDQRLSRSLSMSKPLQSVVTVMLLRGPQTISELMNRCERMCGFENTGDIKELLDSQCQKTSPIITHIPRQDGQREDRYMHLLCGEPDLSTWSVKSTGGSSGANLSSNAELVARVEKLERMLARVLEELGIDDTDETGSDHEGIEG